jgi:hypothetical protein
MTSKQLAKLCFAIIAVATSLPTQPSSAADFAYLSATGGGTACTAAAPCSTFLNAFLSLLPSGGRILCLGPVADTVTFPFSGSNATFDIDCPAGSWGGSSSTPVLNIIAPNLTLTFRNMAFNGISGATSAIKVGSGGSGTLIFENCAFANFSGLALDIEPTAALNLVVTNSRMSNNAGGVLLKPGAGGSVTATFDHVRITDNAGGGIKSDTTNGAVTEDITDSVISNNAQMGINADAGATAQNIVSIRNSIIAKNGVAGVRASGVNAGVLLATTLLDQNAAGATSVISGGNMFTYGNNSIVGFIGSGFTASAPLQ